MATKLRWEFPATIETIEVQEPQMTVRSCLHGIDEHGKIIKTLYCTRDGRFFMQGKNGWHELRPCMNRVRRGWKNRSAKGGGCFDTAYLRIADLGATINCHRLVAYAWCEHPACAKTDPLWYKRYECDHLNGDHGNWTADNLQWVTPAENRRRAKLARCMRKIGLQPRWLYHSILRGLYSLTTELAELVINRFRFETGTSDDALTIGRINSTFAFLLDELKSQQQ